MNDPLEEARLSALLPPDNSSGSEEHLDLVSLAAYLDRALEAEEIQRVEEHLASCHSCRALATETAGALHAAEPVPLPSRSAPRSPTKPRFRGWRSRAIPLAAGLLIALAAWLLLQGPASLDPRLEALGADASTFADAPGRVQTAMLEVLEGTWPHREDFAGLAEDPAPSVLRNPVELGPWPAAPRWTLIRERRPTLRWYPAQPGSDTAPREEVLLVDEGEKVVATLSSDPMSGEGSGRPRRASFPAELPPLEAGALYAWRVNSRTGAEQLASPFVPFRVLDAESSRRLDRDLATVSNDSVLTGLLLAHHGLYAEAVIQLSSTPKEGPGAKIRESLVRSCLERTIADPTLRDRELRRLLGTGSP